MADAKIDRDQDECRTYQFDRHCRILSSKSLAFRLREHGIDRSARHSHGKFGKCPAQQV